MLREDIAIFIVFSLRLEKQLSFHNFVTRTQVRNHNMKSSLYAWLILYQQDLRRLRRHHLTKDRSLLDLTFAIISPKSIVSNTGVDRV